VYVLKNILFIHHYDTKIDLYNVISMVLKHQSISK